MNKKRSKRENRSNHNQAKQMSAIRALLEVLWKRSKKSAGITVRQLQQEVARRARGVGSSTIMQLMRKLSDSGIIQGLKQASIRIRCDVALGMEKIFNDACRAIFGSTATAA